MARQTHTHTHDGDDDHGVVIVVVIVVIAILVIVAIAIAIVIVITVIVATDLNRPSSSALCPSRPQQASNSLNASIHGLGLIGHGLTHIIN